MLIEYRLQTIIEYRLQKSDWHFLPKRVWLQTVLSFSDSDGHPKNNGEFDSPEKDHLSPVKVIPRKQ